MHLNCRLFPLNPELRRNRKEQTSAFLHERRKEKKTARTARWLTAARQQTADTTGCCAPAAAVCFGEVNRLEKCFLSPNCSTTVPPHWSNFIWLTLYLLSVEPAVPESGFDQRNPGIRALNQSLKRICASSTFSHDSINSEFFVILVCLSRPRGCARTEGNEPETPPVRQLLPVVFGE